MIVIPFNYNIRSAKNIRFNSGEPYIQALIKNGKCYSLHFISIKDKNNIDLQKSTTNN